MIKCCKHNTSHSKNVYTQHRSRTKRSLNCAKLSCGQILNSGETKKILENLLVSFTVLWRWDSRFSSYIR